MNTLSDDGGRIGNDLLAELASQSVQNALLGFQYLCLVLSHTCLSEVEAFDHHAPGSNTAKSLIRPPILSAVHSGAKSRQKPDRLFEIANLSNGKRNARQNVQSQAIGTNLMAGQ